MEQAQNIFTDQSKKVKALWNPRFLTGFTVVIDVGPDQEIVRELDDFSDFSGGSEGNGKETVIIGKAEGSTFRGRRLCTEAGCRVLEGEAVIAAESPSVIASAGGKWLSVPGYDEGLQAPGTAAPAREPLKRVRRRIRSGFIGLAVPEE